jgi:hypothetical protein
VIRQALAGAAVAALGYQAFEVGECKRVIVTYDGGAGHKVRFDVVDTWMSHQAFFDASAREHRFDAFEVYDGGFHFTPLLFDDRARFDRSACLAQSYKK